MLQAELARAREERERARAKLKEQLNNGKQSPAAHCLSNGLGRAQMILSASAAFVDHVTKSFTKKRFTVHTSTSKRILGTNILLALADHRQIGAQLALTMQRTTQKHGSVLSIKACRVSAWQISHSHKLDHYYTLVEQISKSLPNGTHNCSFR